MTNCTCATHQGVNGVHESHCAMHTAKPEHEYQSDNKCNCTARHNGGMHDSTCTIIQSEPLIAALHSHIKSVAARPLDQRMLVELERTCMLAREMMMIGKHPNGPMRRGMIHSPNVGMMPMDTDYGMPSPVYVGGSSPGFGAMQAISSPNETFGVTAIRELVAGLAALNKPPEAPAILKDMQDTITRLENELKTALNSKPAIEVAAEPPLEQAS